jgi:hypothetical protein
MSEKLNELLDQMNDNLKIKMRELCNVAQTDYAIDKVINIIKEYELLGDKIDVIKTDIMNNDSDNLTETNINELNNNLLYNKMLNDFMPYMLWWWMMKTN